MFKRIMLLCLIALSVISAASRPEMCDDDGMLLEIRFVDQKKNIFGVCWDTRQCGEEDQLFLWDVVSAVKKGIQPVHEDTEGALRFGLFKIQEFVLCANPCVCPIFLLPDIKEYQKNTIKMIVSAPCKWQVVRTHMALEERVPGSVSVSAKGEKCCLLRTVQEGAMPLFVNGVVQPTEARQYSGIKDREGGL